jgi:uncharacterized protein YoxC
MFLKWLLSMDALDALMGQSLTSWVQTSGLALFMWLLVNGLQKKISSLEGVIDAQSKTMEVMDKRVQQSEGIGSLYKQFFDEMPIVMESYKTVLSKDKEASIIELQRRNSEDVQKLEDILRAVYDISNSALQEEQYLRQLNKLIDRPPNELGHMDKLYIRQISEFNGRLIDAAVPILLSSSTLEEFLNGLGFELRSDLTQKEFIRIIMSQVLPDGSPFQPALICNVSGGTSLIVTDRLVWTCSSGLDLLNAEYSYAREI